MNITIKNGLNIKYIHICIVHVNTQRKKNAFIQAFNMFILIHKTIAEIKHTTILILRRSFPANSYVAAMFHPTIGQCAHQPISSTATLELGMIPTRNKGTTTGSHIAKAITKFSQAKTKFGFIRLLRSWKGWTTKLVSSTIEILKPAPDLAWILKHLHAQHKEASPSLLRSPSGYAFPSSALRGVQRRKPTPLDLSMRFPCTLHLSS